MLFTSMLKGAYSFERLFTKPTTADRTEFERMRPSIGCLTAMDVIVINRPHCCCFMMGSTSRAKNSVLMKFRSTAERQSATDVSVNGLLGGPPAFVTQISMRLQHQRV